MGRRSVTKNLLEQEIEIEDGDIIARVLEPRGKNLHLIEYPKSLLNKSTDLNVKTKSSEFDSTLCTLPPKFRNMVWIKRGSFVIINLYEEKDGKGLSEGKVGGTIKEVLFPYHIKRLKLQNKWPLIYENDNEIEENNQNNDDLDLVNPNHRIFEDDSSEEEED